MVDHPYVRPLENLTKKNFHQFTYLEFQVNLKLGNMIAVTVKHNIESVQQLYKHYKKFVLQYILRHFFI